MANSSLDSSTREMLHDLLEEAWQELLVGGNSRADLEDEQAVRDLLARRLLAAANDGERDPERLKEQALEGLVE